MFEVNDRKKARALASFCMLTGLENAWTLDGPTSHARRLQLDGRELSETHRMVLNAVFALHDGSAALRVGDLWRLDENFGEALTDLILALGDGDRSLDRWVSRYSQTARSGTQRLDLDGSPEALERKAR